MKRLLFALALVLAGCGQVSDVREKDLVVGRGNAAATQAAPDRNARGLQIARARIVFITHGQASDPFWTVVKNGIADAEKDFGVSVDYRNPPNGDLADMAGRSSVGKRLG